MNWMRRAAGGTGPLLGSAFVAVLLAPVLPDLAVDWFSGTLPDGLLRVIAIVVVLALCVGIFYGRIGLARRRARHHGYQLADLQQRDVLVLPLGFTNYQRRDARTGRVPLACWLVDTIRPDIVIGVSNPGISGTEIDRTRTELAADHVRFDYVRLSSAIDATTAVPEAQELLQDRLGRPDVTGRSCYVDVTGGTVVLTIAMLQSAAALGLDCVYVASEFDDQRNLIEGSQTGRSFDPRRFGDPPTPGPTPAPHPSGA